MTCYERQVLQLDKQRKDKDLFAHWSVEAVPAEQLSEPHPFPAGAKILHDHHWGVKPIEVAIGGATWLDVWIAADQAILLSGDTHHRFIEIVECNGDRVQIFCGS